MNRTRMLITILVVIVLVQWVLTAFFFKRLPEAIPLNFPETGYPMLGPRFIFFLFPAITTLLAAVVILFVRFKDKMNFFGKKLIRDLPEDYKFPVFERAYQVGVMTVIILIMLITYIQINIAMFATGQMTKFNPLPFWGVFALLILYFGFNTFIVYRLASQSAEHYKQNKHTAPE